jgi:hypothetical protein
VALDKAALVVAQGASCGPDTRFGYHFALRGGVDHFAEHLGEVAEELGGAGVGRVVEDPVAVPADQTRKRVLRPRRG